MQAFAPLAPAHAFFRALAEAAFRGLEHAYFTPRMISSSREKGRGVSSDIPVKDGLFPRSEEEAESGSDGEGSGDDDAPTSSRRRGGGDGNDDDEDDAASPSPLEQLTAAARLATSILTILRNLSFGYHTSPDKACEADPSLLICRPPAIQQSAKDILGSFLDDIYNGTQQDSNELLLALLAVLHDGELLDALITLWGRERPAPSSLSVPSERVGDDTLVDPTPGWVTPSSSSLPPTPGGTGGTTRGREGPSSRDMSRSLQRQSQMSALSLRSRGGSRFGGGGGGGVRGGGGSGRGSGGGSGAGGGARLGLSITMSSVALEGLRGTSRPSPPSPSSGFDAPPTPLSHLQQQHRARLLEDLVSPFIGSTKRRIICSHCNKTQPWRVESTSCWSMDIVSQSIEGCLNSFFGATTLSEYDCGVEGCRGGTQRRRLPIPAARVETRLARPPRVLILQLNRLSGVGMKNGTWVDFRASLDLTPYMTSGGGRVGEGVVYDLMSVVVHLGGGGGGHYVTYRRLPTPIEGGQGASGGAGRWVRASDRSVEPVVGGFESVRRCEAYMLFYVLRETTPGTGWGGGSEGVEIEGLPPRKTAVLGTMNAGLPLNLTPADVNDVPIPGSLTSRGGGEAGKLPSYRRFFAACPSWVRGALWNGALLDPYDLISPTKTRSEGGAGGGASSPPLLRALLTGPHLPAPLPFFPCRELVSPPLPGGADGRGAGGSTKPSPKVALSWYHG